MLSSFTKTGISPLEPAIVLDKMASASNSRPVTATSSDNAPAAIKQRKKVRFVNEVKQRYEVQQNTAIKLDKIVDKLCSLDAENSVLKHEIISCKRALFEANKKKTRTKTLIEELRSETGSGAIIFSPTRIQSLRDKYDVREAAKEAEESAKQLARDEKKAQSLAKAADKEQRRVNREKQAQSRKVSQAAESLRKAHQKDADRATEQLAIELQQSAKKAKKPIKQQPPSLLVTLSIDPAKLAAVVNTRISRLGRPLRPNRRLFD